MHKRDEKGKRKAEDHPTDVARCKPAPKVSKAPGTSAAWATAFISEVSIVAEDALKQTASDGADWAPHSSTSAALQQELLQRKIGDAEDLSTECVVFGGHGRVWEVCHNGPLLQATAFSLRRDAAGGLSFVAEHPPVVLASADSGSASNSRALAGSSVLDHCCGLVRPFIAHQHGSTIQLSAVDTAGQAAQPVVTFQLPSAGRNPLQACRIADGPMIVGQSGSQSLLVAFRGTDSSQSRPSPAPASGTVREHGSMQIDSWHVHEVQLPGVCRQRSLLWASMDSRQPVPGNIRPLVCIVMGCSCGAEAKVHGMLELQYMPGNGWRAEQTAQPVRPTAVCRAPRAASAALEAGISAPAPRLAVATAIGELLALEAPPGRQPPHALLRTLPKAFEAQPVDGARSGSAKQVEAVLRGSLAERMHWQTADAARPADVGAACQVLARFRLPHAAQQLAFALDGGGGQLMAVCGDRERTLCCLEWPSLQQGTVVRGVSAVASDITWTGICFHGQGGWLATEKAQKSAVAFLDKGTAAGASDIVQGMRRPALLLPFSDVAPREKEAEAAEGMRAVLGALRRRLEDGCRAVQDVEQLAGRKAALTRSSLRLLHTLCSRTFQPASQSTPQQLAPPAAAAAPAAGNQRSDSWDEKRTIAPSEPAAMASGAPAATAPVLVCEELSAALQGDCCAICARLRDECGSLNLCSGQLLVLCAGGPITATMQPAQDAHQQPGPASQSWALERHRERGSSSVRLCCHVDVQGLAAASSRAPLNLIAVVPLRASSAQRGASMSVSGQGASTAQSGHHMQHVGSLTLDWSKLLLSQQSAASLAAPAELGAVAGENTALPSIPGQPGAESGAAGSTATHWHQERAAHKEEAQAETSQSAQHRQVSQQVAAVCGPQMPSQHQLEVRLCLEADKGSVGDASRMLETALGLRLDWLTSHGARLSAADSSTVALSFHGSQHAEVTVQSASASLCHLLERGMQEAVAASGMKMDRSWNGKDDIAALSRAIDVLCVEVNARIGHIDRELQKVDGYQDEQLTAEVPNVLECMTNTDLSCSSVSLL